MEYSDSPQLVSDDKMIFAMRMIIRQEIARALLSEEKDQLLTVSEAADLLRLSVHTIYSLVQKNQIPYMKKTKRLYFSEKELTEWLENGRVYSQSEREKAVDSYLVKHRSGRTKIKH
ncbi:excisionase [Prosthecochloris sp. GSB1]|uniref:helix-turn-helix domain-containing protein n=1 Tax=Prosthecochloris sp. GSB1 TaxID=281093 RepID=UPI000B8D05FE|nr:helix-turn-helix domain-containing protein [Prosthecochloris sp. GSB1]ASQ90963.1 excisionase [Prosthecochloris sp. GSB1]